MNGFFHFLFKMILYYNINLFFFVVDCNDIPYVYFLLPRDMLATGCEDKMLRVFFLSSNSDQPIKQLSGISEDSLFDQYYPLSNPCTLWNDFKMISMEKTFKIQNKNVSYIKIS